MPQSSAAKRTPMARQASNVAKRAGLPKATDSVSSISEYSAGKSASANIRRIWAPNIGPTWLEGSLTASQNDRHVSH